MKAILIPCLLSLVLVTPAEAGGKKVDFNAAQREAFALVERTAKTEKEAREKAREKFVFGLQEGGSTFGYGQTPLKIKEDPAIDAKVMDEARAKLRAALPEKPTEADERKLLIAELGLQERGGDSAGRAAALKPLLARPTDRVAAQAALMHYKRRDANLDILAFAERILAANRGNLEMTVFGLGWRWYAAHELKDGRLFAETRAKIEAMPLDDTTAEAYMILLGFQGSSDPKDFERLEKNLDKIKRSSIKSNLYCTLLEGEARWHGDYKSVARLAELAAKYWNPKDAYATAALGMMRLRCWTAAVGYAEKAHKLDPSPANQLRLAQARLGAGERAAAEEPANALAANEKAKPAMRFAGRVLALLATAREPQEVTDAIVDWEDEVGAKDGEEYATWLLEATNQAFEPLMTSDGTKWLLALRQALFALSHEEERIVHNVRYYPSAPRTAAGAEAAGLFDPGWFSFYSVENRFAPYMTYAWNSRESVLGNLKCKPKPDLVGVTGEGRSAAIIAVYDETGVHVYTRFRDPSAAKYGRGEAPGCGYEFTFQADERRGWTQVFTKTDAVRDLYEVVWDSVDFGHHPFAGGVVTDSTTTDDAFLFHTFIPWTHVYTSLPKDGDTWNTVMCAKTPVGTRVLGGGQVHELGRGMKLRFAMDDGEERLVRRALVRRAAGDFIRFSRAWENIDMWEDRVLGDPQFFREVVKDWRDDCVAAATALIRRADEDVADGESEALFAKYLRAWLDPRLTLDAMRVDWLRGEFFGASRQTSGTSAAFDPQARRFFLVRPRRPGSLSG